MGSVLIALLICAGIVYQYLRQKNSGFYEDNQISVNNTAKLSRPNGVPSKPLDERENNQHVQFSLLDVKADYRKTEDFHIKSKGEYNVFEKVFKSAECSG